MYEKSNSQFMMNSGMIKNMFRKCQYVHHVVLDICGDKTMNLKTAIW